MASPSDRKLFLGARLKRMRRELGVTQTRMAESVQTIGHFDLVDRLGIGSFGSVWKARDTELDRTVAVKIPRK